MAHGLKRLKLSVNRSVVKRLGVRIERALNADRVDLCKQMESLCRRKLGSRLSPLLLFTITIAICNALLLLFLLLLTNIFLSVS